MTGYAYMTGGKPKCRGNTRQGKPCKVSAGASGYCKRHTTQLPKASKKPLYVWQPKKTKATRPDVVERRQLRKEIVETVVPASLPGRLGVGWSPECRALLREEVDKWVLSTSKITHRLSIIFNRLLLHLLKCNKTLPAFKDSLFTAMALHGMKESNKESKQDYAKVVQDFCDNEFNVGHGQYPKILRQRGDCQAIVIAALKYKTNFLNTCHVPFLNRQKQYIQVWLDVHNISNVRIRDIQWKINGWKPVWYQPPTFSNAVNNFIDEQRWLLKQPNNVCEAWLKRNVPTVLSYYYHILQFFTQHQRGKKFRLAPLCQIKCHFLVIDDTVLRELLTNVWSATSKAGLDSFPSSISDAIKNKRMSEEVWKSVFNFEGLRRKRRFGHQAETDGVKICFHFQSTKKKVSKANKRRRCKNNKKAIDRVIAIDPGRANLITAYDTESQDFYRLSRPQYYRSSGMNKCNSKAQRRHLKLKGVYEAMSKTSTKSINDFDWYQYQQVLSRNYDKLWSVHTSTVRRQDAFRVSCLKERCLDRFFNQFVKDGKKPTVAYGAASMNPTGKGELAVPVKYVYKKCCQKFPTIKEDERFSTKMHYKCQQPTTAVIGGRSCYTLRGLRWCPTCRELVSRDPNACKNIALSFLSEKRPTYLCGTSPSADIPNKVLRSGASTLRAFRFRASVHNSSTRVLPAKVWQPRKSRCLTGLTELLQDWNEVLPSVPYATGENQAVPNQDPLGLEAHQHRHLLF